MRSSLCKKICGGFAPAAFIFSSAALVVSGAMPRQAASFRITVKPASFSCSTVFSTQ